MAIARIQMPDGRITRFEVPDGTTPEQAQSMIQSHISAPDTPAAKPADNSQLADAVGGVIKGASRIGTTLLTPVDYLARKAGFQNEWIGRTDRDQAIDQVMKDRVNPDSFAYKAGDIGTQIAGTAGAGGMLAKGLAKAAPALAESPFGAKLLESIASSGFRTGAAPAASVAGKATDIGIRAAGGAITGGASAGLVNPEDAKFGAMVGGALPLAAQAAGKAFQVAGQKLRGSEVSPEVNALAKRASELGIDVPADRLVNSKPLNAIASALNYVPFSGRAGTEAAMQSQLNRALSRTVGQDSENVTAALRKATGDLGAKFDQTLSSNTVRIDNQLLGELANHEQTAFNELSDESARIIKKQIDEILAKGATGEIDGQAAYNIKKTLDRIGSRNSNEAYYARELKKSLMGALNRSLSSEDAAAFAKVRQQYGNMLELENLAQNGVEGNISIARIANMKHIRNPELQELADISAQFLKPREGQHGAMQRAVAGMAAGGMGGIPGLAGIAATGRGTNMLLNSATVKNALLGEANPALGTSVRNALAAGYRIAPVISAQGSP
ncbi:hypothetical protein SAMN06265795_12649 [Noviherbaspirillum humi]|uniref:Uncharacterized protein n=1 Tax=Noviherbaspirillum humi TaxID=1688639 RepID=A0A239LVG0_9BURK|nr:hypothetical protein [Noviherbaspirillum humi]SNT33783.1 hypothetical protein SAMN06265795_12649 [Noviherbaspirillum humi]